MLHSNSRVQVEDAMILVACSAMSQLRYPAVLMTLKSGLDSAGLVDILPSRATGKLPQTQSPHPRTGTPSHVVVALLREAVVHGVLRKPSIHAQSYLARASTNTTSILRRHANDK